MTPTPPNQDARKERGYVIAQNVQIVQQGNAWKVPSQSGQGTYDVVSNGFEAHCSCPDHELRRVKCKHLWAVELIVTKQVHRDGSVTMTMRKTYAQPWRAYNTAQTTEKAEFMRLLADLTSRIQTPAARTGRPSVPLSDAVFGVVFKTYSTMSARRFMSDLREAHAKDYISSVPCYNSLFNYLQKSELTPLLHQLIQVTSLPLASVEHSFSLDSSGFTTTRFARWFDHKWGKEHKDRIWLKAHLTCGNKTNIVTDVTITPSAAGDAPEAPKLIAETAKHFQIQDLCADKAYSSRAILDSVKGVGGTAYIAFRDNATGNSGGSFEWRRLYHYFMLHRDDFLAHYHQRSNVETTFHMIKSKFGDYVRSRSRVAQENEILCKILAHNIVVVIHEIAESGIAPNFYTRSENLGKASAN